MTNRVVAAGNIARKARKPAGSVVDDELQRMMTNWARWRSGVSIHVAVSAAYTLEARGRREEVSVPLINGEASDVDDAVRRLLPEIQLVVEQYWTKPGTIKQKARAARCALRTFYLRLDHAHRRVRVHLQQLRDVSDRRRAALDPNEGLLNSLAAVKQIR